MPTADLRALAERLGMLKECGCLDACERCKVWPKGEPHLWVSTGRRLPTEAEVRVAIFEAGWTWLEIHEGRGEGTVVVQGARRSDGPDREARAENDEAPYEHLVLLALLRALEAARG